MHTNRIHHTPLDSDRIRGKGGRRETTCGSRDIDINIDVWNCDRRAWWRRAGYFTGYLDPGEMEVRRVGGYGHFRIERLEAAQGSEFSSFLVYGRAGTEVDGECEEDDQPDGAVEGGDSEEVPF